MGRQENIEIFKDTEKLCKENAEIKQALQKSRKGQKLIPEDVEMPLIDKKCFRHPAKVVVSKKRTLEAAAAYKETKTAVHNFASASNPGGGVERGANAQEECLCRCSDLYFCLNIPDAHQIFLKRIYISCHGNTVADADGHLQDIVHQCIVSAVRNRRIQRTFILIPGGHVV